MPVLHVSITHVFPMSTGQYGHYVEVITAVQKLLIADCQVLEIINVKEIAVAVLPKVILMGIGSSAPGVKSLREFPNPRGFHEILRDLLISFVSLSCLIHRYLPTVTLCLDLHSTTIGLVLSSGEKREEIWCSRMTNTPKRQTMHIWNYTKTLQIRSITQLPVLRTDLTASWSDNSQTAPWLTCGLRPQPSHFPQSPCNQKDKHLKIYK